MVCLKYVLLLILFSCSTFAVTINLNGTITNQSGDPIKGALVTLKKQKLSDTTDSDGSYTFISGTVPIQIHTNTPKTRKITFERGIIGFSLITSLPVHIALFDMHSIRIRSVVNKRLSPGNYTYNVMSNQVAQSMIAVRISIGNQHSTFRYLPLAQTCRSVRFSGGNDNSSINHGLAKTHASIDSLAVSADNYISKTVAVNSLEGNINVTLDSVTLEKFSFFVTSYRAIVELSGSQDGFGGDLRFGKTGPGAGLLGADSICECIAEMSMPGSKVKQWRAFLSVAKGPDGKQVNAIDRIGEGPWYDRIGRMLAPDIKSLLNPRPVGGHSAIQNDLPNEDGVPNHRPEGTIVDNHHFITGSNENGELYSTTATCNDWTSTTPDSRPRCGLSWPRDYGRSRSMMSGHWISSINTSGCEAGADLDGKSIGGLPGVFTIGNGGGYGGFYCFALKP